MVLEFHRPAMTRGDGRGMLRLSVSFEDSAMRAMIFDGVPGTLSPAELPMPAPGPGQALIKVRACGVCRTDLHIVDGELTDPKRPVVPGHEIVGTVVELGDNSATDMEDIKVGDRVGVPWLGGACASCHYCRSGKENLCDQARFTGYQLDGGYAEYAVADTRYCFPIGPGYSDAEAAPLLCAGLIGYRALRMAGEGARLGIYGFGAAAHIIAQVAQHQGRRVFAFTQPGDESGQNFAQSLGAEWAGGSDQLPPEELDAAIIFAPVGALVPTALRTVAKGGVVVCAGIHMSDIPSFPYDILWGEKTVRSVANLTRRDGQEFMALAPQVPVRTEIETFPLANANEALQRLRTGKIKGAAVLTMDTEMKEGAA